MNMNNEKNIVYVYNSKKTVLKEIKTFDTLEECFNFISEQNRKYTKNVKAHNNQKLNLELDLF